MVTGWLTMHLARAKLLVTLFADASPATLSQVPPRPLLEVGQRKVHLRHRHRSVVGYAFENPVMRSIPWSSSLGRQWT